ncbi:hypothetical protein MYSTI_01459 [Myxococcus stipitatus DSM 14675]|uniref:Glycosyltransferase RgtA/B/C/D-like domain-containing protein n=1 Tax=Myxococcus stipitatus (strain DSM 14675 / JCM 12634 / Mx s8) TaxID=1278073 RepID=L7U5F0_MYXSD|nr:hypothetical protein [Myxococcus stipitatus]AGC42807.1 hypothetical protein MYSTI_01459 [Myxococcus stipitatus DSM 14675]
MSRSKSKRPPVPAAEPSPTAPAPEAPLSAPVPPTASPVEPRGGTPGAMLRVWFAAYRVEVVLFAVAFVVLASFSSQRFLRQSAAPHFIYQAQSWLEGRLDVDPQVLPNLEDWACVRQVNGEKVRCEGRPLSDDRWFVSFPSFPAVAMLPFVALHGYQFNDTSFGVIVGALAVALFYSLLRFLAREGETERTRDENVVLALTLAFGTLFFYCAIRGEVWFSAEVMGVALTCLYVRNAVRARRPVLAGVFFSMATLTRTPLFFAGLFFVLEALCPGPESRLEQLKVLGRNWKPAARKLGLFALGAAPLGLLAAGYNVYRFGRLSEFGHAFLFNNRVNVDIDRWGLFHWEYLGRNVAAAFLKWPTLSFSPLKLGYDPHGLTLLLTLPLLVFLLMPRLRPRLHWPLWLTVAICALPGLFYQNTGYMQFGFRFSLDYTPYLLLLFAIGGWSVRQRAVMAALVLGVLVNFWGAVAFRGYTELVRNW